MGSGRVSISAAYAAMASTEGEGVSRAGISGNEKSGGSSAGSLAGGSGVGGTGAFAVAGSLGFVTGSGTDTRRPA
jgi:hypothetical protein